MERRRENLANSASDDNVAVIESLWRDLPEEVLRMILACLPLSSLLRFCSVCKKWSTLLQDGQFQEMRFQVCGKQLYRQYIEFMQKSPAFAGCQVVSSVGGLLLLTSNERNDVYIINPSKPCHRRIPPLPNLKSRQYIGCGMIKNQNIRKVKSSGSRYDTVGMIVYPETGEYNILAVSKGSEGPVSLNLYDSFQDAWRLAGTVSPEPGLLCFHALGVALHEGCLHCLSASLNEDLSPRFRVLRFEKKQRRWHEVLGVFPEVRYDNRSSPLLFVHRGRLLLVGAWRKNLYIWQHDSSETLEWRIVECWPHIYTELSGSETGFGIYSHACGDYLCVGTYPIYKYHNLVRSLDWSSGTVLIFNIPVKSWRLLRKPEAENCLVSWQRRKFLFEPKPRRTLHCNLDPRGQSNSAYLIPPDSKYSIELQIDFLRPYPPQFFDTSRQNSEINSRTHISPWLFLSPCATLALLNRVPKSHPVKVRGKLFQGTIQASNYPEKLNL